MTWECFSGAFQSAAETLLSPEEVLEAIYVQYIYSIYTIYTIFQ